MSVVDIERHLTVLTASLPSGLQLPVVAIYPTKQGAPAVAGAGAGDIDEAVKVAAKLRDREHLYVGLGAIPSEQLDSLRRHGRRGGADDVAALVGLHVDLDIAGRHHAMPNLPPTDFDAFGLLDELPMPTVVVRTGGGLQAVWMFDRPVDIDSTTRGAAAQLLRDWQSILQERARQRGWHVDSTCDLARVVRLAGTLNHKSTPAAPTTVDDKWWRPAQRFDADDLRAFATANMPRRSQQIANEQTSRDLRGVARRGPDLLAAVDAMPWSSIWPAGWTLAGHSTVNGHDVELWRRPGASSHHSVTCWPAGGAYVHSSAIDGLPVGPTSKARVYAWRRRHVDVRALVAELAKAAHDTLPAVRQMLDDLRRNGLQP